VAPRIGVLGGTFDPVHIGHLSIAVEVRSSLSLDRVLLVVAGAPWQKADRVDLTPAHDRLAVVRAAVADVPGLEASDLEVERSGPTYTADTLAALSSSSSPGAELFLIVGSDVAGLLDTWVRPDEVRRLATLVVVARPGSGEGPVEDLRRDGWRVESVEVPALEVSSTDLRQRRCDGRPIDVLVPPAAVRVIEERGLYPRSG
jgi:nicotinate-nucleotide adenylyltransferase